MREWGPEGKVEKGATIESSKPVSNYADAAFETVLSLLQISLAGRVITIREAGPKLRFYDVRADGQKVQVLAQLQ